MDVAAREAGDRRLSDPAGLDRLHTRTSRPLSRADAAGKLLSNLIIPPLVRDAHKHGLEHFLKTGEGSLLSKRIEVTAMRADGSEFPIEAGLSHLTIGQETLVIVTVTDISKRKEIETQLEQRVAERTREIERRRQVADGLRNSLAILNSNRSLAEILEYIADQAQRLMGHAAWSGTCRARCGGSARHRGRNP